MPVELGIDSYVAWRQQAAWGTKLSPTTNTFVAIRGEPIFKPRPKIQQREITNTIVAQANKTFPIPPIVDWACKLELTGIPSTGGNLLDLLTNIFGKRVKAGAGPFTHTFTVETIPIDAAADAGANFYGHGMTMHWQIRNKVFELSNCIITQAQFIFEAGNISYLQLTGIGTALTQDDGSLAYTAPTGNPHLWNSLEGGATTEGLFLNTSGTLAITDGILARRATITINPNLRQEPYLGLSATQYLITPSRAGLVEVGVDLEMDFDLGFTNRDAQDVITAWVNSTIYNFRAISFNAADDIYDFKFGAAANSGGLFDPPTITPSNEGPIGFTASFKALPLALATDLTLVVTGLV